jgi:hypothetical protein
VLATAVPTLTHRASFGARTFSAGSSIRPVRPAGPTSWIAAASAHTRARYEAQQRSRYGEG